MPRHRKKIIDAWSAIILLSLVILDIGLWQNILTSDGTSLVPRIYFLNVSQGESILTVLPNAVTAMTDAGSDDGAVQELQKIFTANNAYIDLAIISYPQFGDYAGYEYVLDHYQVGAFIYNGRSDFTDAKDWQMLVDKIATKHIPLITIAAGDTIHEGGSVIDILAPDNNAIRSADLADTAIVQLVDTPSFRALLASGININGEQSSLKSNANIKADILKISFSGIGTQTGGDFLAAVGPRIVIVAPGIKNMASAESKEGLKILTSSTKAIVWSTEQSGTIEIVPHNGKFLLYNK